MTPAPQTLRKGVEPTERVVYGVEDRCRLGCQPPHIERLCGTRPYPVEPCPSKGCRRPHVQPCRHGAHPHILWVCKSQDPTEQRQVRAKPLSCPARRRIGLTDQAGKAALELRPCGFAALGRRWARVGRFGRQPT